MARDLTRWNRSGMARIDYVDGNAAVFLERLRSAMITQYLRGVPEADPTRAADYWFSLFANDTAPPGSQASDALDALQWETLARGLAVAPESKRRRNTRLTDNYDAQSPDYAVEILRALARVSHVLTGHIDAYANETKLATAAEWDSLRKLARMVNYAPRPAASAFTSVALELVDEAGAVRLPPGLPMAAKPPAGGPELIFETLDEIEAHPDLNAARVKGWDYNARPLDLSATNRFVANGEDGPSPGAVAVVAPAEGAAPAAPATVAEVTRLQDEDIVTVRLETSGTIEKGNSLLWYSPAATRRGLPVTLTVAGTAIVMFPGAGQVVEGSLVEVQLRDGTTATAVANTLTGNRLGLTLSDGTSPDDVAAMRPMLPQGIDDGYFETAARNDEVYFNVSGGVVREVLDDTEILNSSTDVRTGVRQSAGTTVAYRYRAPGGASAAGVVATDSPFRTATLVEPPTTVTTALSEPENAVEFAGKPPKGLKNGDWFVARQPDGTLAALKVEGIRLGSGQYTIAFNAPPGGAPHTTDFLGPMQTSLRPEEWDRGQNAILAANGTITLTGLSPAAGPLIRVGRSVIIEAEPGAPRPSLLTTITEVQSRPGGAGTPTADRAVIKLAANATALNGFVAGYTLVRLNVVMTGHGEEKGTKILGSGNGSVPRQTAKLDAKSVSMVADSLAEAGVRPAIEIRVNEVPFAYADLTDATAEGTDAYSVRVRDDDTLDIVFRRRLPSGRNNLRVTRHRVGAGEAGNGLPPGTFTKPKVKHRHVGAIVQPFATAGGAAREPVESIRDNAGNALAANGRAVSLADITRLARRHVSVWDALATRIIEPGRALSVSLTVVPSGGTPLTAPLATTLSNAITEKALPGLSLQLRNFVPLPVRVRAHLRVDTNVHIEEDVQDAAQAALLAAFALRVRRLGQPFFIAEPIAAAEAVPGVVTATVSIEPQNPAALADGQTFPATSPYRAIYPARGEVAFIAGAADLSITTEPAS